MSEPRTANEIDRRLGERIRIRRRALGMSQTDLADAIKPPLSFQQIQKYEQGTNRVAVSRAFDIADALQMPLKDLLKGLGQKTKARRVKGASQ